MKRLFQKIGDIFRQVFNAAARTWARISDELKAAIMTGSGIVATINENIDKAPKFILEILAKEYPEASAEHLHEILLQATKGLAVGDQLAGLSLEEVIAKLQEYLKGLKGSTWANISQTLAMAIAAVKSPDGTKFTMISSVIDFVYHAFIKKDKK